MNVWPAAGLMDTEIRCFIELAAGQSASPVSIAYGCPVAPTAVTNKSPDLATEAFCEIVDFARFCWLRE
jgi:hypothetical protein